MVWPVVLCYDIVCVTFCTQEKECTRVELPCSISNGVVRSGLATLLRFMTLTCHSYLPEYGFNHLLVSFSIIYTYI